MQTKLNLIAAACENLGIGKNGDLPWRLKNEMAYFTRMTSTTVDPLKKNAVIMGRKTWESIPLKYRPLANRINIVLTTQNNFDTNGDAVVCSSLDAAIESVKTAPLCDVVEGIWVIGGSSVYQAAMDSIHCHRVYLTSILKEFECDTFFPPLSAGFTLVKDEKVPEEKQEENGIEYIFKIFQRV